jgi:hypothetical protein
MEFNIGVDQTYSPTIIVFVICSWSRTLRMALIATVSVVLVDAALASPAPQLAYVSPGKYRGYSCNQLLKEARAVSGRAIALTWGGNRGLVQNKLASAELTVVLPAVLDSTKRMTGELAGLKAQMEAIEEAAIQSQCDIEFVPLTK